MRTLFPERLLRRVTFLLLTLPLGVVYFGVLIGGLASAVGGAFIIGIPLFVGLMFLWRALARFERRLLLRLLDVEIEQPYRPPVSRTRLGRIRDRAADPATWKDLAYLLLLMPLGLVSFTIVVCLSGTAVGLLTLAAWGWAVADGVDIGFFTVDTVAEGVLTIPLAVVVWMLFLLSVLTNVARYAHASVARVDVRTRDGRLAIEVADDGVGGAEAGSGSGLRGLADRLGALGGELQVRSPPGEGTRLTATIPLDQPEPVPELTVAAAAETGGLGRRILQSHAVVYALVMALLVFVWLTTGADYFWPRWPIAGWGLVLALHAWCARARPVGMLDRQTRPDR